MPARGIFITGTDTDIGKTEVACAIASALRARNLRVGVYKPAETGCKRIGGVLVGDDCTRLAAAAGNRQKAQDVAGYALKLAAAPLIAAEAENVTIDIANFRRDYIRIANDADVVIVEGAGGLMVPITERYNYADLAEDLSLPVLCVVGSRLGCINHALLTFDFVTAHGLTPSGYVTNCLSVGVDVEEEAQLHRHTIARMTDVRDIGLFPYLPGQDRSNAAKAAETHLKLDQLLS